MMRLHNLDKKATRVYYAPSGVMHENLGTVNVGSSMYPPMYEDISNDGVASQVEVETEDWASSLLKSHQAGFEQFNVQQSFTNSQRFNTARVASTSSTNSLLYKTPLQSFDSTTWFPHDVAILEPVIQKDLITQKKGEFDDIKLEELITFNSPTPCLNFTSEHPRASTEAHIIKEDNPFNAGQNSDLLLLDNSPVPFESSNQNVCNQQPERWVGPSPVDQEDSLSTISFSELISMDIGEETIFKMDYDVGGVHGILGVDDADIPLTITEQQDPNVIDYMTCNNDKVEVSAPFDDCVPINIGEQENNINYLLKNYLTSIDLPSTQVAIPEVTIPERRPRGRPRKSSISQNFTKVAKSTQRMSKKKCQEMIRLSISEEGSSSSMSEMEFAPVGSFPCAKRKRLTNIFQESDNFTLLGSPDSFNDLDLDEDDERRRLKNNEASKKSRDKRKEHDKLKEMELETLTERNRVLKDKARKLERAYEYIMKALSSGKNLKN